MVEERTFTQLRKTWFVATVAVGLLFFTACANGNKPSGPAPDETSTTAVAPPTSTTTTPPPPPPTTTVQPPPPQPQPTTEQPAPPPPPPPVAEPAPRGECDPNYTGCVPIASDVDCEGGSGNGPAYADGPVEVIGSDIYGLDHDKDGVACE